MPDTDVAVVGAGPAGCTLACLLARDGFDVTIVDRADGPEFKIGESLLPEGVRLCARLGLADELERRGFLRKLGARFVLAEDGSSDRFAFAGAARAERGAHAYQVKRIDFDAMLQEHALRAGARLRRGFRVESFELDGERGARVTDPTRGETIRARFLVDASGTARALASRLGATRALDTARRVALFAHFAGIERDPGDPGGDIVLLWSRESWTWIIPFADGSASVGFVLEPAALRALGDDDDERFARLCEQSDAHRQALGTRRQLMPLQRRADWSYRSVPVAGERWLALGDAACFVDPVFSSGVYLAQQAAFLAHEALAPTLRVGGGLEAGVCASYADRLRTGTARFETLVDWFYGGRFLAEMVRSRERRNVRRALTSLLAGDVYDDDNLLVRTGVLAPAAD